MLKVKLEFEGGIRREYEEEKATEILSWIKRGYEPILFEHGCGYSAVLKLDSEMFHWARLGEGVVECPKCGEKVRITEMRKVEQ